MARECDRRRLAAAGAGAVVITAVTLLILPRAAASSPAAAGVGIQVAPVHVTVAPGAAGHARVTVADTGPGPETLATRGYTFGGKGRMVPPSWVRGATVTLAPAGAGTSLVTVTVPAGTPPGRYHGGILASAVPGAAPGGLSLGAAALTDLVVTVRGRWSR